MGPGEPIIINAFDKYDDENCGCETCTTPWGTEVPEILLNPPGRRLATTPGTVGPLSRS